MSDIRASTFTFEPLKYDLRNEHTARWYSTISKAILKDAHKHNNIAAVSKINATSWQPREDRELGGSLLKYRRSTFRHSAE